jgi:hypothetical protein
MGPLARPQMRARRGEKKRKRKEMKEEIYGKDKEILVDFIIVE